MNTSYQILVLQASPQCASHFPQNIILTSPFQLHVNYTFGKGSGLREKFLPVLLLQSLYLFVDTSLLAARADSAHSTSYSALDTADLESIDREMGVHLSNDKKKRKIRYSRQSEDSWSLTQLKTSKLASHLLSKAKTFTPQRDFSYIRKQGLLILYQPSLCQLK